MASPPASFTSTPPPRGRILTDPPGANKRFRCPGRHRRRNRYRFVTRTTRCRPQHGAGQRSEHGADCIAPGTGTYTLRLGGRTTKPVLDCGADGGGRRLTGRSRRSPIPRRTHRGGLVFPTVAEV